VPDALHAWLDNQLDQYVGAALLTDSQARAEHDVTVRLGSRRLTVSGSAAVSRLLTDLRPLDIVDGGEVSTNGAGAGGTGGKDLHLNYLGDASLATLPDTSHLRRGPYGAITAWANSEAGTADGGTESSPWLVCLEEDLSAMLAFHIDRRQALAFSRNELAPRQVAEFARTLMHWAAIADGNVIVHAAAVARGDRGLLVCGVGTSGKTTLVRQCIANGWTFLADNVVEFGPAADLATGEPGTLWSTYATLKLRPDALPVSPAESSISQWDDEAEKNIHFLTGSTRDLFATAPVRHTATLVLQPNGASSPEPLDPGAGLLAIAPNTVAQFPFFEREVLQRVSALTRSAPLFTAGRMPLDAMTGMLENMLEDVSA
jgi:hypothetical protein